MPLLNTYIVTTQSVCIQGWGINRPSIMKICVHKKVTTKVAQDHVGLLER